MQNDGRQGDWLKQPVITLSEAEKLFVQSFKELVYAYPVRLWSQEHPSPLIPTLEDVGGLPAYHRLAQILTCYTLPQTSFAPTLFALVKALCERNIPGNFVEYGWTLTFSTIVLAYALKMYSRLPRLLYILPPPAEQREGRPSGEESERELSDVSLREIAVSLGIQDILKTTEGAFQDILAQQPAMLGMIALLHCPAQAAGHRSQAIRRLRSQLAPYACVLFSDTLVPADNDIAQEPSEEGLISHVVDKRIRWGQRPDGGRINPLLRSQDVEHFVEDERTLAGIASQMSVNERFQLHYLLSTMSLPLTRPLRFVEIGSYSGSSLLLCYLALKRRVEAVQGIAIEPQGTEQFYDLLRRYPRDFLHMKTTSDLAAPVLQQWFAQEQHFPALIFVDGNHRYPQVKQDIQMYLPLLAPNGLIVFHDYLPALNEQNRQAILAHHAGKDVGIKRACDELIEPTGHYEPLPLPLLYPDDLTQSQAHLPIIPQIQSTLRAYRKRGAVAETRSHSSLFLEDER